MRESVLNQARQAPVALDQQSEGAQMTLVIDILSWALLLSGSVFVVIGGIGMLRLPDFFTRLHAAGITDTAGAGLIMLGLLLQAGAGLAGIKLIFMIVLIFIASPTASHALAKSALYDDLEPWRVADDEIE